MSLSRNNPVNIDILTSKLHNDVKYAEQAAAIYKALHDILDARQGQEITKRIATALDKVLLGHYVITYQNEGSYHIYVWGQDIPYEYRLNFFLGYSNEDYINLTSFEYYNQGLAQSGYEAAKLRKLLDEYTEELALRVQTWNQALKQLQDMRDWADGYGYSLSSAFDDI